MVKEEEKDEGQGYVESVFNIDLPSGLRSLSLMINETARRH